MFSKVIRPCLLIKPTLACNCRLTYRFPKVVHLNREERTLGTRLSIRTRSFLTHHTYLRCLYIILF